MGEKKEYIERGALIEFVKQNTPHIDGDTTMQCVERAMKAAPAADVVEVVRCKDCKHFVSEVCRHDFAMNLSRGDDFCSYGERKEQT